MYPYIDLVWAVLQPRYVRGISRDPKRLRARLILSIDCPEHVRADGSLIGSRQRHREGAV